MLTKIRNKKQEKGFSLLELAVAVGIAAIVAAVGVTASTVFVNGSQTKADNYAASADNELLNAKASFDALYGEGGAPNPLASFAYTGVANETLAFTRGEASQSFTPTGTVDGATYSVTNGTLPTGVTLNPTTGALTGPADWGFNTTRAGGTSWDEAYGVTATSDGGAILTGYFQGTATFGGTTLTSAGNLDVFVAKVDASGNYVWAARAGGTSGEEGRGVTATSDGGAILTGYFGGTATFGGTTLTSAGSHDVFVAKVDSSGAFVWATRAGGTSGEEGRGVTATSDGGAILTGYFQGTATFGGTTLTSAVKKENTMIDVFVAKVDSSGAFVWATRAGGAEWDNNAYGVTATSDGGVIIVGALEGTATFGETTLTSAGNEDLFVAKVDSSGAFVWATRAGGAIYDIAYGVAATSDGGAIITGHFNRTATFGGTTLTSADGQCLYCGEDVFVAKVNSSGSFVWATRAGGTSSDYARGVTATSDGGAILTGYFEGTATFGGTTLTSAGNEDLFVAKVDSSGAFVWASRAGGTTLDYAYGVTATSDGGAILTGYFGGTATFGGTTLTSAGGSDVFVAKVDASGAFSSAAVQGSTGAVTISVTDGVNSTDYIVTLSTQ